MNPLPQRTDTEAAALIDSLLPERLRSLQRLSGLSTVFGGSTHATSTSRQLRINCLIGTLGRSLHGLTVLPGRGVGGAVLQEGVAQRINDYAASDAITHHYDDIVVREENITSVLAVPVVVGGTVNAVLYGALRDGRLIGDRAMRVAAVIAGQLQQDLERPQPCPERPGRSPLAALGELANIIEATTDAELRSRLVRVHRELCGPYDEAAGARPSAKSRLTAREVDTLRLVAVGASNLEIAAELRLSPETVKAYLRAARQKLGVHNRVAAVHAARLSGLL
ncbi:LuxR C-terminal-related transcriptional regulator [Streptomyces chartreusis]|uniref:GAF domain-containing protein n=1 Tax=Streptomyces chartreusis TaxID=1969 RepID=A0A7H8T279_STRCX|nr:LuxR C-terminal-related transcriptional regulator [Streptomyces chartreusis]QKZ17609.1 GAF domain-containing protein [Streptomyces chartreusis]